MRMASPDLSSDINMVSPNIHIRTHPAIIQPAAYPNVPPATIGPIPTGAPASSPGREPVDPNPTSEPRPGRLQQVPRRARGNSAFKFRPSASIRGIL